MPRPVRAWPVVAPLRRLRLVNAHTGESFDGPFRDDIGPIAVALAELSELLRDHHSGEKTAIDVGLLDFLASVMDAVGEISDSGTDQGSRCASVLKSIERIGRTTSFIEFLGRRSNASAEKICIDLMAYH
jgi:uncharacterized protein YcbK (DUF882 family)